MKKSPTPTQVANEFIAVINEWLPKRHIKMINELNATPEYKNCCATHNFCDANVAMDKAFTRCGIRNFSLLDDKYITLWNTAWELAIKNKFQPIK